MKAFSIAKKKTPYQKQKESEDAKKKVSSALPC